MTCFEIVEKVADLINLAFDYDMKPMMALRTAGIEASPKPGQLPLSDVLVENTFNYKRALLACRAG